MQWNYNDEEIILRREIFKGREGGKKCKKVVPGFMFCIKEKDIIDNEHYKN